MQHPGWILVMIGLVIAGIGAVRLLGPPIPWLGRLPGDIAVERPTFRFIKPYKWNGMWVAASGKLNVVLGEKGLTERVMNLL